MGFVDHLKGVKGETRILEVAFGLHVVRGDLAKSIVTGTSPNHVVTIQQMLGDALGNGWKGPKGIWYNGINRAAAKYKFHPGKQTPNPTKLTFTANATTDVITATGHTFANGDMIVFDPGDNPAPLAAGKIYYARDVVAGTSLKIAATSGGTAIDLTDAGTGTLKVWRNDPDQGVDPVFDQDTPHSNVAWIRVECPSGSETGIPDANTKDNPPTEFSGIFECQLGDIYDASGNVTASDQLLTNPADVLACGLKEIRRYPNSRIDWASLATLRTACDQTYTPDYTTLLPQGVGLTGRYYEGTSFGTLKQRRVDPVIQYDLSSGAPALDLTPTSFSVRWEGKIRFKYAEQYTLYLTHNDGGKLWVQNLTTELMNQAAAGTHSATFTATAADQFHDIKMEWTNASGDSQFMLEWESPSQPRQVVPQDRLYPKNEPMKRFESHVAFTSRTNFDDFLRAVEFTFNGTHQDVDGKLKFFIIDDQTPSFHFDAGNIVNNSINYRPRFSQAEILNLPNRFIAEGRDLESRYLEPFDPPLIYELTDLQAEAGRIVEETVFVGNMPRAQALENLRHHAKIRTAPMVAEFEGMPQTFPVLPGDLTTMTHELSGWTDKQFICLDAIDNSIDAGPDNRKFVLLDWGTEFTPANEASGELWLRAKSITGLSNDDQLSTWTNLVAGATFNVSQATSGKRPLYKANSGQPYIAFDGTDDTLDGGDNLDLGTDSLHIFAVIRATGTTVPVISKSMAAAANDRWAMIKYPGDVQGTLYTNAAGVHQNLTTLTLGSGFVLVESVIDRVNGVVATYINGVLNDSDTFTPDSATNVNSTYSLHVGSYNDQIFGAVDIKEIFVAKGSPLSSGRIADFRTYFNAEHALGM